MSTEPAAGTPQNPYRVCAPADILSLIPHTLGFEPRNSLVLLALCAGRLGATLRLDLPPGHASKSAAHALYAVNAARLMTSDPEADGVLLAVYSDLPWTDPARPPYRPLIRRLEKELRAAGTEVRDGWLVGADTWRNYFCVRRDCCPWPGTPKQQISDSMLNAELVYRGSAFAPSLEKAVGESLSEPWTNAAAVAAARDRFTGLVDGHWGEREQFRGTLELWARATAGEAAGNGPVPPGGPPAGLRQNAELAGFLLASLQDRSIRDTLLVLGAAGVRAALAGAAANGLMGRQVHVPVFPSGTLPARSGRAAGRPPVTGAAKSLASAEFRNILVGTSPTPPDWVQLDRTHALFSCLVSVADGEARAALLCLLAWIEWARGRGSRSHVYLRQALETSPDYRLALLLRELLGTGVLPDWACSREESWPGETGEGSGGGGNRE